MYLIINNTHLAGKKDYFWMLVEIDLYFTHLFPQLTQPEESGEKLIIHAKCCAWGMIRVKESPSRDNYVNREKPHKKIKNKK